MWLEFFANFLVFLLVAKGQLISKGLFDVIVLTKKKQRNFFKDSALASKKRSDQKKIKALDINN